MDPLPNEAVAAKEGVGTCGRQMATAIRLSLCIRSSACERESAWQDFAPGIEAVSLSAALCVQRAASVQLYSS